MTCGGTPPRGPFQDANREYGEDDFLASSSSHADGTSRVASSHGVRFAYPCDLTPCFDMLAPPKDAPEHSVLLPRRRGRTHSDDQRRPAQPTMSPTHCAVPSRSGGVGAAIEMRRSERRRGARLERSELRTSSDDVIGGGGAPEQKLTASDTDLQESVDNRTAGREQHDHVIEVSAVVEAPDPGGVWRARVRQRQHGYTRTQQREGQQRAQARRSHCPVKYHPKTRTVNAICGVLRRLPSRRTKPRSQQFGSRRPNPRRRTPGPKYDERADYRMADVNRQAAVCPAPARPV